MRCRPLSIDEPKPKTRRLTLWAVILTAITVTGIIVGVVADVQSIAPTIWSGNDPVISAFLSPSASVQPATVQPTDLATSTTPDSRGGGLGPGPASTTAAPPVVPPPTQTDPDEH